VAFLNKSTNTPYAVEVLGWSDTTINAIVPKTAASGDYEIKVTRIAQTAGGNLGAFESNPAAFKVTASGAAETAQIYPNPFNAGKENVNIVITNTQGATNIGYYVYDMTAKLAVKVTSTSNQITWNGVDQFGSIVGDGGYLLRVINEDTKALIAKGKILVVKK